MIGGSAAARRANIGSIGEGSPRPHHGQCQHRGNGHDPTAARARHRLFLIVALIGVRIVRIGRIASIFLLDGFDRAIKRVVIA
jgi:hypothetical protein